MSPQAVTQAIEFLDSWLHYRAVHVALPGFSVAVLSGRRLVYQRAFGLADSETYQGMTPQHMFTMASQTKMVTATLVFHLAIGQRLSLDDPAVRYLPWLAAHRDARMRAITIRQLLDHTSGLFRDAQQRDIWASPGRFPDDDQLQREIHANGIAIGGPEAQTGNKYSNVGYALLGMIVRSVTGQSFEELVQELVAKPLGVRPFTTAPDAALLPLMVQGYGVERHGRRPAFAPCTDAAAYDAVLGLCSTPAQMCRFAAAYFAGSRRFSKAVRHLAYRYLHDGNEIDGYVFSPGFERITVGDRQLIGYSGHMFGQMSATFFEPHQKLAVAVAANCKDAPIVQMASGVADVMAFFRANDGARTGMHRRLNVRAHGKTGTVQVVATQKNIVAINPDDWEPFAGMDDLREIDARTLKVVTRGSAFTSGEVVRLEKRKSGRLLLRYAGNALVPELPMPTAGASMLDPAFRDIRFGDRNIAIGQIIAVRPDGNQDAVVCSIDFGSRTGIIRTRLPRTALDLDARRGLGSYVFARLLRIWSPSGYTTRVQVLQTHSDHGGVVVPPDAIRAIPAMPGDAAVFADQEAQAAISERFRRAKRTLFKIEANPDYAPDSQLHASPSLHAWKAGKDNLARRLLCEETAYMSHPWLRWHRYLGAKQIVRIRIVDEPKTPYQLWEEVLFRTVHAPLLGEKVYLVPRRYVRSVDLPHGDVSIVDGDTVIVYELNNNEELTHAAVYDANTTKNSARTQLLQTQQDLLHTALYKGSLVG